MIRQGEVASGGSRCHASRRRRYVAALTFVAASLLATPVRPADMPGACRDACDEILVHQLDYRYRPCNFVEIMPRLDEHLRRAKAKGATV